MIDPKKTIFDQFDDIFKEFTSVDPKPFQLIEKIKNGIDMYDKHIERKVIIILETTLSEIKNNGIIKAYNYIHNEYRSLSQNMMFEIISIAQEALNHGNYILLIDSMKKANECFFHNTELEYFSNEICYILYLCKQKIVNDNDIRNRLKNMIVMLKRLKFDYSMCLKLMQLLKIKNCIETVIGMIKLNSHKDFINLVLNDGITVIHSFSCNLDYDIIMPFDYHLLNNVMSKNEPLKHLSEILDQCENKIIIALNLLENMNKFSSEGSSNKFIFNQK